MVTTPAMRSHLLVGLVGHRRLRGLSYGLTHRVWYLAADLDELESLPKALRLLRVNGSGVLALNDRDHLNGGRHGPGLRDAMRTRLSESGYEPEGWRITLVTYPRAFGYVFNPVSFFLCHDASNVLRHVVAEVHNTHGEREVYDFPPQGAGPVYRASARKRFYVSPFIGPDASYTLTVVESAEQVAIAIYEEEAGEPVLAANIRLRRVTLTDQALLRALAGDPLVPLKTIALIGFHSLRMWRRGLRWERFRPRAAYGQGGRDPSIAGGGHEG